MDKMNEIISKVAKEMTDKKDAIIFERLLERVVKAGLVETPYKVEEEAKRRFPRIAKFSEGKEEHWYWDNGTKEGLHLVTFFSNENFYSEDINDYKLKMVINYR